MAMYNHDWAILPSKKRVTRRDWANLLPELLGGIARRLTLIDYLHFGAVSTSWRSTIKRLSANGMRVHRPNARQVPWLMMASEEGESSSGILTFITNLADGKSFRISLVSQLRGGWWLGSGDGGWLVILDAMGEMRLINPLTRSQLRLPPATTFPGVEALRDEESGVVEAYHIHNSEGGVAAAAGDEDEDDDESDIWTPMEFRIYQFGKVVSGWVYSNPPSLVAMAIVNPRQDLAFARAGGESWDIINQSPYNSYQDIIYSNGLFFTVTSNGDIQVWELNGTSPSMKMAFNFGTSTPPIIKHRHVKKYLVESRRELYQVWRDGDIVGLPESGGLYVTTAVVVIKFSSSSSSKKEWVRVESLGEQSFFLGANQAVALSPPPEIRRNCIYFTDDCWFSFFNGGHQLTRDMGVYSLEDRTYQPYYPPEQQVNWPAPIWFMPKMF